MKKGTIALAVAVGLALGGLFSVAQADEMEEMMMNSYCPMMVMQHSKELGLSKKQTAKIQEIKDRTWAQIKPIAQKSSGDVEEVLNAKQEAKYKEIMAAQSKCGCCKDKGDGESCGMKEKH